MHEAPATKNTPVWQQIGIDILERVGATFLQTFLGVVFAGTAVISLHGPKTSVDWLDALGIAAFAAVAALLTSALRWGTQLLRNDRKINPYLDLLYRVLITFAQTLLGYVSAAGAISALSFNWNTALVASAGAAGQALFKGLIGLHAPTLGASTLVKAA